MKKLLCTLSALLICLTLGAQAKLYTQKARLADFYSSTTMVVLGGNPFLDAMLKNEVISRWRVSPYEFCTAEEYETLKNSSSYYFLSIVYKDMEPGLVFLSLSKGGKTDKTTGKDSAFDIVMLPFDTDDLDTGRSTTWFGAFVDFVQAYTEDARIAERNTILGLSRYNRNLLQVIASPIYVSKEDLMPDVVLPEGFVALSTEETDAVFEEGEALVAVVFCPKYPQKGAKSYQLVMSAETHDLVFFNTHPFDTYSSRGFSSKEVALISKFLH